MDPIEPFDINSIMAGYDIAEYDPAVEQPEHTARVKLRDKIARDVADNESLLGTTADAAALAVFGVATLIKILKEHGSASLKQAIQEASNGQLVTLADDFLQKIEKGTIKLPALEKGLASVIADISVRSTGVAEILTASKNDTTVS